MRWKGNDQSQERGPSKGELHTVDSLGRPKQDVSQRREGAQLS